MSPVSNFTTAPIVGSQKPFKFIVYGDMGVSSFPRAKETAELMLKEYRENDVKFIFHNGDISYARGQVRYFINVLGFHNGFRYIQFESTFPGQPTYFSDFSDFFV